MATINNIAVNTISKIPPEIIQDRSFTTFLCSHFCELWQCNKSIQLPDNVFNIDGIIDDDVISQLAKKSGYPECLDHKAASQIIFSLASINHIRLLSLNLNEFESFYSLYMAWTSDPKLLVQCFKLILDDDTDLSFKLSSAVLDRSLGDLYLYLSGDHVCLLKDLLSKNQLEVFLGHGIMFLIKTMMGLSTSFNMRNVFWHGYPCEGEMKACYSSFLLIIIISIGGKIVKMNPHNLVTHRNLTDLTPIIGDSLNEYKMLSHEAILEFEKLIFKFKLIHPIKRSVWLKALRYYSNGEHFYAVVLILGELEHCMRRLFCSVNVLPENTLLAESNVLFVTLDDTLVRKLSNGDENKLWLYLSQNIREMMLDMFIEPDGLRLRDRASHGEILIERFSCEISHFLIYLSICVLSYDLSETPLLFLNILESEYSYSSKFSTFGQLMKCILTLASQIDLFPDIFKSVTDMSDNESYDITVSNYLKECSQKCIFPLKKMFSDLSLPYILEELINSRLFFSFVSQFGKMSKCKFVKEPSRQQLEAIGIFLNISKQLHIISNQLIEGYSAKKQLHDSKSLRSRQRKNFMLLVNNARGYISSISCILLFLYITINNLNFPEIYSCLEIKQYKRMLQIVENICTGTSPQNNKWQEVVTLFCSLLEIIEKHFIVYSFYQNL